MPSHLREWLFLGAVVAVLVLFRWLRRVFWLFSVAVLPGTFAHEGLHYLTGLLFRGGPVSFNLLPRREGKGWAMGSVTFNRIRWYNAFFIGLAPLLLLPAAYFLAEWRLRGAPVFGWREGLAVYLIANLVYAALPSGQDLKIAARSPIGWLLLAAGMAWGWHAWDRGVPSALPAVQGR